MNGNSLIGQAFGRWIVIDKAEARISKSGKSKQKMWLCKCSCENKTIREVREDGLKRGTSKSCGCIAKEDRRNKTMYHLHKKYNSLTIINIYLNKEVWYCDCECECGKIKDKMILENIVSNKTKTCGYCNNYCVFKDNKAYNIYKNEENYIVGYLSNGKEFYFDLDDYDRVKEYYWQENAHGYACTQGKNGRFLLHRFIMDILDKKDDIQVDHIYHNKLDNRKSKLRIVTRSQNQRNRPTQSNNTSGYSGVSFNKNKNKWHVRVKVKNKEIHIGYFEDKNEAIKARKEAEVKYYGEYRYITNK